MTTFDERLIVRSEVGLDLIEMVVRIGERIVHVRRPQMSVLLNNLLDSHPLAVTRQDGGDANSRADHNSLAAAACRVLLDTSMECTTLEPIDPEGAGRYGVQDWPTPVT